MSEFKLDGNNLRNHSGSKIAYIDGNAIRDHHGSKVATIDGRYIRDPHGSKLAEFDGEHIRDSHGSRIGTLKDVEKVIDGHGGISLVALWLLFIR